MAQERCIRRHPDASKLWEVGEVRGCRSYNDQGHPVAAPHFRLVEDDERVANADLYDEEEVKRARREAGMRDQSAGIRKALEKLDVDNNEHWTSKGAPSLQKVHTLCDFDISRATVVQAWPEFDREFFREQLKIEQSTRDRQARD